MLVSCLPRVKAKFFSRCTNLSSRYRLGSRSSLHFRKGGQGGEKVSPEVEHCPGFTFTAGCVLACHLLATLLLTMWPNCRPCCLLTLLLLKPSAPISASHKLGQTNGPIQCSTDHSPTVGCVLVPFTARILSL